MRLKSLFIRAIPLLAYFTIFTAILLAMSFHYEDIHIEVPTETYNIFVISAYYYSKSKSLGDNSVAIVLTGDYEMADNLKTLELVGYNQTSSVTVNTKIELITPHQKCKWVSMYVTAPLLPNMQKLAIYNRERPIQIPFTLPDQKRRDVVTCIAPLFANEQWQMALFAAHTYRRFGSHMHLYVRSMVSPLYEVLREYEKEDYLTIQPWLRLVLSSIPEYNFNPNLNVEFRNQAAAQTDCLLQYKESAKFISFVDLDDILFPSLATNYLDEFQVLFNQLPNIAYIHYAKRNFHAKARLRGENFSLTYVYDSLEEQDVYEAGKFVAKPKYVNATWIHYPVSTPIDMVGYTVPHETNAITHFKKLTRSTYAQNNTKPFQLFQKFGFSIFKNRRSLLRSEDITAMERDFRRMLSKSAVRRKMSRMPTKFLYFELIDKCFHDTYYSYNDVGNLRGMKCPGPERCELPTSPGIPCYNSNSNYQSENGVVANIHFHKNDMFLMDKGCHK